MTKIVNSVKYNPYLTLMGELLGVYFEDFREKNDLVIIASHCAISFWKQIRMCINAPAIQIPRASYQQYLSWQLYVFHACLWLKMSYMSTVVFTVNLAVLFSDIICSQHAITPKMLNPHE